MTPTITPEEAADRLAIRELIDAYAHCADRRDANGQMALFTEDTAFHVFILKTAVGRLDVAAFCDFARSGCVSLARDAAAGATIDP